MNKEVFFSIVIPTYNRAAFIEKTIRSVLNQREQNFEIIVVDDGSTDNTEEIVKAISSNKIRYYKIPNSERGHARNYGASVSNGSYVNFLDSDDTLYPNHLSEAEYIIGRHSNPEFFHLGYDIKDENEKILKHINKLRGELRTKLIKEGNLLSCNGVFIRQDVIKENPFNEDRRLSGSEDYELWLRLSAKYLLYYSNEITSSINNHGDRSVLQMNKEKLISRYNVLMDYAMHDKTFMSEFGRYKNVFTSNGLSYISLHLSLTGKNRRDALRFMMKAIAKFPGFVFKKRFFAILKHLLLR